MPSLDSGEPFGLPKGTVRGIIALGFAAVTLGMWATGQHIATEQLAITTLIVGNYFGVRGTDSGSSPAREVEAPLAEPAVGGDASD